VRWGKFVVIGVKREEMPSVGETVKGIKLEIGIAEKKRGDCEQPAFLPVLKGVLRRGAGGVWKDSSLRMRRVDNNFGLNRWLWKVTKPAIISPGLPA